MHLEVSLKKSDKKSLAWASLYSLGDRAKDLQHCPAAVGNQVFSDGFCEFFGLVDHLV